MPGAAAGTSGVLPATAVLDRAHFARSGLKGPPPGASPTTSREVAPPSHTLAFTTTCSRPPSSASATADGSPPSSASIETSALYGAASRTVSKQRARPAPRASDAASPKADGLVSRLSASRSVGASAQLPSSK